jgi:hypothetical protein
MSGVSLRDSSLSRPFIERPAWQGAVSRLGIDRHGAGKGPWDAVERPWGHGRAPPTFHSVRRQGHRAR